jgi:hypothetical protein
MSKQRPTRRSERLVEQEERKREAEYHAAIAKGLAERKSVVEGIPEGMYATTYIPDVARHCPKCDRQGLGATTGSTWCIDGHSWSHCTDCNITYGPITKARWGGFECPLCHGARNRCKTCNAERYTCDHTKPRGVSSQ